MSANRHQAIESVVVQYIEEDGGEFPASTPPNTPAASKKRGEVSVGSGEFQGAVGASGGQWKPGGAPMDAPRNQVLSVTGRSGDLHDLRDPHFNVRKAPMPFPVPRCCGDCARSGPSRRQSSRQPFGVSRLRRVRKPPHEPESQDSGIETFNATTWSAHVKAAEAVSESNRASAFDRLSNKQPLPCRHTLSRALPTPGASPQSAKHVRSRQRNDGCRPALTCARRGSADRPNVAQGQQRNAGIVARPTAPITRSARLFA